MVLVVELHEAQACIAHRRTILNELEIRLDGGHILKEFILVITTSVNIVGQVFDCFVEYIQTLLERLPA